MPIKTQQNKQTVLWDSFNYLWFTEFSHNTGEAGGKANEVVVKGQDAEGKAMEAKEQVKDILVDLPNQLEKTVPLANDALNTNRDIKEANVQGKN